MLETDVVADGRHDADVVGQRNRRQPLPLRVGGARQSAAASWASVALPPFPNARTRPPRRIRSAISRAELGIRAPHASSIAARRSRPRGPFAASIPGLPRQDRHARVQGTPLAGMKTAAARPHARRRRAPAPTTRDTRFRPLPGRSAGSILRFAARCLRHGRLGRPVRR